MKHHNESIGARICDLRVRMGLTQHQFADLVGVTRGKLSQIEISRTDPDLTLLRSIVSKCNITYEELIEGRRGSYMAAEPGVQYGINQKEYEQLKNLADQVNKLKPVIDKITKSKKL